MYVDGQLCLICSPDQLLQNTSFCHLTSYVENQKKVFLTMFPTRNLVNYKNPILCRGRVPN